MARPSIVAAKRDELVSLIAASGGELQTSTRELARTLNCARETSAKVLHLASVDVTVTSTRQGIHLRSKQDEWPPTEVSGPVFRPPASVFRPPVGGFWATHKVAKNDVYPYSGSHLSAFERTSKEPESMTKLPPTRATRARTTDKDKKINTASSTEERQASSLRSSATPSASLRGSERPFKITGRAQRGEISVEELKKLRRFRKTTTKEAWAHVITGTSLLLRTEYLTRKASTLGVRKGVLERELADSDCSYEKYFRLGAQRVLELACQKEAPVPAMIAKFLDVAWAVKHRSAKAPSISHLGGPALMERVSNWDAEQQAQEKDELAAIPEYLSTLPETERKKLKAFYEANREFYDDQSFQDLIFDDDGQPDTDVGEI